MNKKVISILTALFIMISVIPFDTVKVIAEEKQQSKYHLDIGFDQMWLKDGAWDYEPGKEYPIKATLDFGREVDVVALHPYGSIPFDFSDKSGKYSKNAVEAYRTQRVFENNYLPYSSTSITNAKAHAEGTKVILEYTVKFDSKETFDLATMFMDGKALHGEYLYGLLGGESNFSKYRPDIYQKFETMFKNYPGESTKARIIFVPAIIEYREKIVIPPEASQAVPPADTKTGCSDVIQWSEVKTHTYTVGSGENKVTRTCNHVYTYQSKLNSSASLTAAKPNGNATTFKSGYGFMVNLNNSITTSQIGNAGACGKSLSKANSKKPTPPLSSEVKTDWTVKLKDSKATQPKTVLLAKAASTATTSKFVTAANPISHYKNAQIYTDVALKGTKKKPVKHTVTVYTYGGGVNGVQFCKSIPLSFTINGNMYEDDWTVDRLPK